MLLYQLFYAGRLATATWSTTLHWTCSARTGTTSIFRTTSSNGYYSLYSVWVTLCSTGCLSLCFCHVLLSWCCQPWSSTLPKTCKNCTWASRYGIKTRCMSGLEQILVGPELSSARDCLFLSVIGCWVSLGSWSSWFILTIALRPSLKKSMVSMKQLKCDGTSSSSLIRGRTLHNRHRKCPEWEI